MIARDFDQQFGGNNDFWGEAAAYPVADWQYAVESGHTRLGYWDWVVTQHEEKLSEYLSKYSQLATGKLPTKYPPYIAFGEQGEFVRPAKCVGELPHSMILPILQIAAQRLGVPKIEFGVPVGRTLGLKPSEVEADSRDWLTLQGERLPLALFWQER